MYDITKKSNIMTLITFDHLHHQQRLINSFKISIQNSGSNQRRIKIHPIFEVFPDTIIFQIFVPTS